VGTEEAPDKSETMRRKASVRRNVLAVGKRHQLSRSPFMFQGERQRGTANEIWGWGMTKLRRRRLGEKKSSTVAEGSGGVVSWSGPRGEKKEMTKKSRQQTCATLLRNKKNLTKVTEKPQKGGGYTQDAGRICPGQGVRRKKKAYKWEEHRKKRTRNIMKQKEG